MDALEPEKQNLDQLCDSLLKEGKLRIPCHQRQNNLLKAKKGGSERCNDFMDKLDKLISVAEMNDMTEDEWGIHLFAEAADQQMTKVARELLATKDQKILD